MGKVLGIDNLLVYMPDKETMFADRDKIYDILQEQLNKKETDYWIQELQKVGIWCGKVNDYEEAVNDPQIVYNGIIKNDFSPGCRRDQGCRLPH